MARIKGIGIKRVTPSMRIINIIVGALLVVIGVWLMFDFLIKFFAFVVGIIFVSGGLYLIMKKWSF